MHIHVLVRVCVGIPTEKNKSREFVGASVSVSVERGAIEFVGFVGRAEFTEEGTEEDQEVVAWKFPVSWEDRTASSSFRRVSISLDSLDSLNPFVSFTYPDPFHRLRLSGQLIPSFLHPSCVCSFGV